MELPKITFNTLTFEENMDIIAMFIYNELNSNNKDNTNYFKNEYKINNDFSNKNMKEISIILQKHSKDYWDNYMKNCENKIKNFQNNWNAINDEVMMDLSNRLNIKWPKSCLNIKANIGHLCYCPRFIEKRSFNARITDDINDMKKVIIHEICHFLYFEKWKELFNDYDETHYNIPHIIWFLSEAIIDPLLNNQTFKKYINGEILSYKQFYETKINNENIIDKLRKIMIDNSIEEAIKISYDYFLKNEDIIKGKIN